MKKQPRKKRPFNCVAIFKRFPDWIPVNRPLSIDDVTEIPGKLRKWKCVETRCKIIQLLDMDNSPVVTLDNMSIKEAFENFQSNHHAGSESVEMGEVDYALKITERRQVCSKSTRWFWRLFNPDFSWQWVGVEKLHTENIRFITYLEKLLAVAVPEEEPLLCPSFYTTDDNQKPKVAS